MKADKDINDITFWGINIPKEIKMIMDKIPEEEIKKMPPDVLEGYKLGIENTLSIMEQILDQGVDSESITFYRNDTDITTEMTVEEVLNWLERVEESQYE